MTGSLTDVFNSLGLSTTGSASSSGANNAAQSMGQADFLKLLTTQMTHQDPTNPMENGEFISEMAQFSTASGIRDLQTLFKDFATSISSDQALQAASLVGRNVSAVSSEGLLSAGGTVSGEFELPASSDNVKVQIVNPQTDQVIRTIDLDSQSAGSVAFEWDGMDDEGQVVNPGVYKVEAYAKLDGKNTQLTTNINSKVQSVTMGSGSSGLTVDLVGIAPVKFNDIKRIL